MSLVRSQGVRVQANNVGVHRTLPSSAAGVPAQPYALRRQWAQDDPRPGTGGGGGPGIQGPPGPPGPPGQWTRLTRAQYDALSPPDPETLYVIVG